MLFDDVRMISVSTQFLDLVTDHCVDKSLAFAIKKFLKIFRTIANLNENDCDDSIKRKDLIDQYIITYYEERTYFKTIADVISDASIT